MSLWKIAWRSIQHRKLPSGLTAFSMALGVALVVAVLVVYQVLDHTFSRSAQGYDLIVGSAKGGPLDLVLSTVFYLQDPQGTIPYSVFEELYQGRFATEAEAAVPVCMGAYYRNFPVVGTTPAMFEEFRYMDDRPYEFQPGGRNFARDGHFESVVGAAVARETGLGTGDAFQVSHGSGPGAEQHDEQFSIVGVLSPTGTPLDRALFIHIEGFWQMHEHGPPVWAQDSEEAPPGDTPDEHTAQRDEDSANHADDPTEAVEGAAHADQHEHGERAITAVLVRRDWSNTPRAMRLPARIDEMGSVQAVEPTTVVAQLFEGLLGNIQKILLLFAVLIVVVAGIGLMVSIYNSMSDRKLEIAIMRALGARRSTVMLVILFESILLSLGGGLFGVLLGHSLVGMLSGVIVAETGIHVGFFSFQPIELILIPGLIVLASAVGYLPAVVAYRTDVAESLKT